MDKKISNIKERILYLTDYKSIAKEKFFEEVGMTYGSFKGKQKESSLNSDAIDRILSIMPDVDANWLITGEGEMLKSAKGSPIVNSYPKTGEQQETPKLPIDAFAGMGAGEFTIDENDIEEFYRVPEFRSADFLIPVKGSSMQPKYNGGDIVACKHIHSYQWFQWGVPHIIHIKDRGVVIKRPHKTEDEDTIELRSDNEKYEPFRISKSEIINIAIVQGVIRLE